MRYALPIFCVHDEPKHIELARMSFADRRRNVFETGVIIFTYEKCDLKILNKNSTADMYRMNKKRKND